ncbi:hypothetical protein TYRP_005339 [Tyrophagus putrescentiae]|nr:hypothetical protein TYRP_005339 [Tyrophagus putrescentiae]
MATDAPAAAAAATQQPAYPMATVSGTVVPGATGSYPIPPPGSAGSGGAGAGYMPPAPPGTVIFAQPPPMANRDPSIPPGLEYLTVVDQLLVEQKVEMLEAFTGWETNNKYAIKNTLAQNVYFAVEENNFCTRNCCGSARPFDMKILDNFRNEIIHIRRPLRCNSCWCPCYNQKMEVFSINGHTLGTIEQDWSLWSPQFSIKNGAGETVLKIDGPCCTWSLCGNVEFTVMSVDGATKVGKITKQWSGIAREMFTDSDLFGQSDPNIPPGLEYLTVIDQLLVQQKIEMLEAFTGWETNNKYAVKNSMGQNVYYAVEDNDCCTRQCCGPARSFDMKIFDNYRREIMNIHRPLRCNSCCTPCCNQELEVYSISGQQLGSIHQDWSICTPQFSVKSGASGETVLKISGPFLTMSCCKDVVFDVLTRDRETKVGKITKQWSGFTREAFTDADLFGVTFPLDLDVQVKATLLAATFLIDFMFFESTDSKANNFTSICLSLLLTR